MKEVIEEILKEEKAARDRVSEAREEAKKIRLEAEKQVQQIKDDALEKAKVESKRIVDQAESNAQKEKKRSLESATSNDESLWKTKQSEIKKTIDHLFNLVIGKDEESNE